MWNGISGIVSGVFLEPFGRTIPQKQGTTALPGSLPRPS